MRSCLAWATLVLVFPIVAGGCGQNPSAPPAQGTVPIEWVEKGIAHEGFTIDLGHRSTGMNGDRRLEPVAAIRRDGKPVANAMVFVRLVSADAVDVPGDEAATAYEPASGEDSPLYAQGKLSIPEAASACVVRFRVVLPDVDQDWTREVTIHSKMLASKRGT